MRNGQLIIFRQGRWGVVGGGGVNNVYLMHDGLVICRRDIRVFKDFFKF